MSYFKLYIFLIYESILIILYFNAGLTGKKFEIRDLIWTEFRQIYYNPNELSLNSNLTILK